MGDGDVVFVGFDDPGSVRIEKKGVKVRANPEPRFVPLQIDRQRFPWFDLDPEGLVDRQTRIEVKAMEGVEAGNRPHGRRAGTGVAELGRFPGGDVVALFIDQVVVAGSGEVGDTVFFDRFIDGNRNRTVLEEGLFEVEDVVGDHLGAGVWPAL